MDTTWMMELSQATGIPIPQLAALAQSNPMMLGQVAQTVGMEPPAALGMSGGLGAQLADPMSLGTGPTAAASPAPSYPPVPNATPQLPPPTAAPAPVAPSPAPAAPSTAPANPSYAEWSSGQSGARDAGAGSALAGPMSNLGAALAGVQAPEGPTPLPPPSAPPRPTPVDPSQQMAALAQLLSQLRPTSLSLARTT